MRTAGAWTTALPPAPEIDAVSALLTDPVVPEHRRSCPGCGAAVGRSRDGRPGRSEGFCSQCRAPYSFTPRLAVGDLVAGQYEVAGCLAHGGMGWIYLARDRNVSDRWVVLKGVLSSGDPDALAAAIAESRFLAQVEHPGIVEIYNVVRHHDAGYIVMAYVGGRSVKQLLRERMRAAGGVFQPLPVVQAVAYLLETLPALHHLHQRGLVYCDLKPDHIVQVGERCTLIDLGGVRRIGDLDSAIYGTVGYQAPEVAEQGTTVASDIFTVGRTLLVMCTELRGYQSTWCHRLPPAEQTPLFQQHESLHRLLLRCCAPDPGDRFGSVEELGVQLRGLLAEEVGARGGETTASTSVPSPHFAEPGAGEGGLHVLDLPALRGDPGDPHHEELLSRARTGLQTADQPLLRRCAEELRTRDPRDWRATWVGGLAALLAGEDRAAVAAFDTVYDRLPGESAPQLALALAGERDQQPDLAERLYRRLSRTDAGYVVPAAFGLARIRARAGDLAGSLTALDLVPAGSHGFAESRRLRAHHLVVLGHGMADYDAALTALDAARLGEDQHDRLTLEVLHAALGHRQHQPRVPLQPVGRWTSTEDGLRDGLEETYRRMARRSPDRGERTRLVDHANLVRRWTRT